MSVSDEYLTHTIDQLELFGSVTARRMFGGAGLYRDGIFFGLVADDTLYLKVDGTNRSDYETAGMEPFRPFAEGKRYAMGFYEVPVDVLEEPEELARWAGKAYEVALRMRAGKAREGAKNRPA